MIRYLTTRKRESGNPSLIQKQKTKENHTTQQSKVNLPRPIMHLGSTLSQWDRGSYPFKRASLVEGARSIVVQCTPMGGQEVSRRVEREKKEGKRASSRKSNHQLVFFCSRFMSKKGKMGRWKSAFSKGPASRRRSIR